MDRRSFLGSAMMLAAGAVTGTRNKVKTHGPVDMEVEIWSAFTVPCMLSSDPDRNRFHVLIQAKAVPEIHAEMKLSDIYRAMEDGCETFSVRTWNKFGEGNAEILAFVGKGNLNFFPADGFESTPPIKLRLEDVRRVL